MPAPSIREDGCLGLVVIGQTANNRIPLRATAAVLTHVEQFAGPNDIGPGFERREFHLIDDEIGVINRVLLAEFICGKKPVETAFEAEYFEYFRRRGYLSRTP